MRREWAVLDAVVTADVTGRWAQNYAQRPGRESTLLGSSGVECGPLLLYFCSTTLRAFYFAPFVLLKRQDN